MSSAPPAAYPDVGKFLFVTLQVGALLWLVDAFHVAEDFGLLRILPLTFFAFLAHAWIPLEFRPTAFLLTSVTAFGIVLGPVNAIWLVSLGTALVAACHLPFSFAVRAAVVALLVALLAAARAFTDHSPIPEVVLPILGSMFMFRLVLYLHHLRHTDAPASLAQRLGYFFLLPNLCFPLFPIVDYDVYRRRYYDVDADLLYQRGAQSIARGLSHIVLYRVVYHHFSPAAPDVVDLGGFVVFAVTSYLLYLRISGQFHLIVGILALFGFHLPPTHRLYFMAAGFNDLWRRVNIYWKDFMVKTTYYPVALRWRSLGPRVSSIATVFVVIGVTWALHSYQWFWLRGWFPVNAVDGLFWGILAVGMAANTFLETKGAGRKTLAETRSGYGDAARRAAAGVATFLAMSLLWSLLASATIADWWTTFRAVANVDLGQLAMISAAVVLLFGTFLAIHVTWGTWHAPASFRRAAVETILLVLALFALNRVAAAPVGLHPAVAFLSVLERDRLNERDEELRERGYYQAVLAMDRHVAQLWDANLQKPAGWDRSPRGIYSRTPGQGPFQPDLEFQFKGATVRTNRWGMRDRDYELRAPERTVRYVLVGGSADFGTGVENDEVYEALIEDRLNRERPFAGFERYEILNFSRPGFGPLRRLGILPAALRFDPDFVLYPSVGWRDAGKIVDNIIRFLRRGSRTSTPLPDDLLERAGVRSDMSDSEIEQRLEPIRDEVLRWAYREFAGRCREHGVVPIWVVAPIGGNFAAAGDELAVVERWARDAGFVTVSLQDVFAEHSARALKIAPWDGHPNPLGHSLIAEALYRELRRIGPPGTRGLRSIRRADPGSSPGR